MIEDVGFNVELLRCSNPATGNTWKPLLNPHVFLNEQVVVGTEDGAACSNQPRVLSYKLPSEPATFPIYRRLPHLGVAFWDGKRTVSHPAGKCGSDAPRQETGNVNVRVKQEPARAPLGWERRRGSMPKPNLVALLSVLLLAGGSADNSSENYGSGDGSPMLSTVTVTTSPAMHSSTGDHHESELSTASATESSFETKSTSSTELNLVDNQDSIEATEQSILIYIVPIVLLVLLILFIIFFVINHKRKKSKQDELGSENVKSPIFEEDTPSVMEIEMEELDKWMNSMNKNADCECLPTVREEEKESIANPSDGES
ncbi:PREDICTED: transmembrane protein 154 [Calidris pugnax]|uniref:transmembrane protein 154 n=1 Tax=Calidris pugnax TaxID=198806 RepID=UPI00071DCED1|nr:PREDICTED: transmembrane protein 154 [Calidris pugnax]